MASCCIRWWGMLLWSLGALMVMAQFEYRNLDNFDQVETLVRRITPENCHIKPKSSLFLPRDSVSHLPNIKEVTFNPVFPNRTGLLHLHNMAHARAFFFSYILQTRFKRPPPANESGAFEMDPGLMYYFLSVAADVAANPKINSSALYFQPNMSYCSTYGGFFNRTMPLFAPRAFRMDDFNDPVHLERTSTMNFIQIDDLGAIMPSGEMSKNYTMDDYIINDWYHSWLPHKNVRQDGLTTFQVRIRYANNTNETYVFHGPNAADETPGPVKLGIPYFDCGRSDKWILPASSPVVDLYHRHTGFRHIEYPTYTAISVVETDFDRIDINQCPPAQGNDGPNRFSDTARCRKDTTECEPLDGYGFRRGGYQCRCRPGYRLPNVVRRPYLGELVERATLLQYKNSFACDRIGWIHKLPVTYNRLTQEERDLYLHSDFNNVTGVNSTRGHNLNVRSFIHFLKSVTRKTCKLYTKDELKLRGDVAFGGQRQFENEARMALRLANFASAFLQIVDHNEIFAGVRVADRPFTEDQMMGEVLSILLGNNKVWAAGMYWERNKFPNRTLFAPFAYKKLIHTRWYDMEDLARINSTREAYNNKPWFRELKSRWSTNFDELEKIWVKLKLRFNGTGMYPIRYERYPTFYKAAGITHGLWSEPEYDCSGPTKRWIVKYAAPFFGWDPLRKKLEFKGAVQVSMDLLKIDINQCPTDYYVQNVFQDTHRCNRRTSYCVPIQGREFRAGGYKCECIQGYEYPFEDPITYFDGQVMEAEFNKILEDTNSRFDFLKCRLAGAVSVSSSMLLVLLLVLLQQVLYNTRR
uniref:G-protein coupled receptor 158 n=1 Tax=Hirondellea gigas TaxID=1518452 RepID=A0A6A7FUN2_9CRUS